MTGKCHSNGRASAAASLAIKAGDVKLKASITDATVRYGPSLQGISISLEKPSSFLISYNVPDKDVKFEFMSSIGVAERPLNLTYKHEHGKNLTAVEGTFVVDAKNKVWANYDVGSGAGKVKYSYTEVGGMRTYEPCYDFSKDSWDFAFSQKLKYRDGEMGVVKASYANNSWDFSVSHKVYGEASAVTASYKTASNQLGLEWSAKSKMTGCLKFSASLNVAEKLKTPELGVESTWDFEI